MPTIEITTRIGCSNNCVYCPQAKLISAYKERGGDFLMSFDTFKKCIDKLPNTVDLEFSGMSEAWLNPDCTSMLVYASEKGHNINVYTTLVGMKHDDFEKIKKANVKKFWLHLPSEKGLEEIPVTEDYLNLLKEVYEFLKKSNIEFSFHVRGRKAREEVFEIVKDHLERKKLSTRADNVSIENTKRPKRKKGQLACSRGLYSNVLLPNGDVLVCCMDYGMKHVIGNLLKDKYEELFGGQEFKRIKAGFVNEKEDILCRYCDMFARNVDLKAKIINNINDSNGVNDVFRKIFQKIKK